MCLTLLQELKGRLYFEDYSYSNCVNSIILLNFVYLVFFFLQYINIKAVTWLHIYIYIHDMAFTIICIHSI